MDGNNNLMLAKGGMLKTQRKVERERELRKQQDCELMRLVAVESQGSGLNLDKVFEGSPLQG